MQLYYAPGVCSLSPHIVLEEAGLKYDAVKTDTKTKNLADGGDGAYFKVNPLGYVPLLVLDDGTKLTEGPAIVQYLADLVPEKKLAPPNGTLERIQLQSWLNFISSEIHKSFGPLFNPALPEAGRKIFLDRLANRFAHVNEHLAGRDYLLGKDFSVADAYLFTVSNWASRLNFDLAPYPNLVAYRKRVADRPAVQAAMKAEGLTK
ncbi:MAG TPA: glutathione transferase GstA [Hyphomicrobiaceae bacterium]|nr:glutathione transferase GstA [Hyphomicrobiaceae bacterium]